jgi:outer membrane protein assembly factor BamB
LTAALGLAALDRRVKRSALVPVPVSVLLLTALSVGGTVPIAGHPCQAQPPDVQPPPQREERDAVPVITPPAKATAEDVSLGPMTARDWPWWRGPSGNGVRAEALPFLRWSGTAGVLWKVAIPGEGHASPVIVGEQVFVSTADEKAGTRLVYCYHRDTGAPRWQTMIHSGSFMPKHAKNTHASATPLCDGHRVFTPFVADDALWLSALDVATGAPAWKQRLGPFVSQWGYASAAALYKNLVIVVGDNNGAPIDDATKASSYLAAVNRRTGAIVWRVRRPVAWSYGTPVVARLAERDQLLLAGADRITAYDPATGNELWFCRWSAARTANAVVCGGDCVYATTTWTKPEIVCVRADGSGDVTDSHLVWRKAKGAFDVPSPLYHNGRLYVVNDQGMALCLDGGNGQVVWQQRLGGAFSASPILAGDRIYATDEDGTTYIFKAEPQFNLLAANALNDRVLASAALSGDRLYLRGRKFLWCLNGAADNVVDAAVPGASRGDIRNDPQGHDPIGTVRRAAGPTMKADQPARAPGGMGWLTAAVLGGLASVCVPLLAMWFLFRRGKLTEPLPVAEERREPVVARPSMVFACSACGKRIKVAAALSAKRVKCPGCKHVIPVPPSVPSALPSSPRLS